MTRKYIESGQRGRILELLKSRPGEWIPLPEILALRVAQYGSRLYELRKAGWKIESRQETVDGSRRSWFRLLPHRRPASAAAPGAQVNPATGDRADYEGAAESLSLFGDLTPLPGYPD